MSINGKLGVLGIVAAACMAVLLWPRDNYGGMSEQGYEITMALYAACNAQSPERLSAVEAIVSSSADQDQINPQELDWFNSVFDEAREGNWQAAAKQSREILMAQVES